MPTATSQPFSQVKNKWISGLTFEYGAWFCNSDNRAVANGCNQYRIQTNARGGRQTLFTHRRQLGGRRPDDPTGSRFGVERRPVYLTVDVRLATIRGSGHRHRQRSAMGKGQKKAQVFLIGHDLYLWSPKGWLTGSSTTAWIDLVRLPL